MQNCKKLFEAMRSIAIIAIVAVISFAFAACDNGSTSKPGGGPALVGTVTIDNTSPKVGDTLKAAFSGNGSGTGTATWQWLANDTAIAGTNSDTYVVKAADVGKTLKARVSYSDRTGNVTSNATSAVLADPNAKTVAVGAQSGTLAAGTAGTVTFAVTTANIADGDHTATVANLPTGVTVQGGKVTIASNSGTLTLAGDATTVEAVTSTLTLTIDGVTSAAFTLTIGAGGGNPSTFTVTGIPAQFDGKYACYLMDDDPYICGYESYDDISGIIVLVKIENGSVSLPMWIWDDVQDMDVVYTGNDTVGGYDAFFLIFNTATVDYDDIFDDFIDARIWTSITFEDGGATATWDDGDDPT